MKVFLNEINKKFVCAIQFQTPLSLKKNKKIKS